MNIDKEKDRLNQQNELYVNNNNTDNDLVKNVKLNISNQCNEDELNKLRQQILTIESEYINNKLLVEKRIKAYQLRVDKEISDAYQFSLKNFISALLSIIDNTERAISILKSSDLKSHSICCDLEKVLKSFVKLLQDFGVTVINSTNVPFNPDIHQAMSIQLSRDLENNFIITVMQKGYLLHNRLLRPAMVIVSTK